jgi:hemoglobin
MKAFFGRSLLIAAVALLLAGSTWADDAPLARKEIDRRVYDSIYDVTKEGVDIYNTTGDEAGCYRLFYAALKTASPLLDHHPDLQKFIAEKMKKAESQTSYSDKAFTLRAGMDEVLKTLRKDAVVGKPPAKTDTSPMPKTDPVTPAPAGTKSLWDRLGGETAVKAVVKDFIASAAKDPSVNLNRNGKYKVDEKGLEHLEKMLVELISQVTGGPLKYSGRDMKTVHMGMGITEAEFNALGGHLAVTLKKYKVPQKEINELMGIIATTKKDIVEKK